MIAASRWLKRWALVLVLAASPFGHAMYLPQFTFMLEGPSDVGSFSAGVTSAPITYRLKAEGPYPLRMGVFADYPGVTVTQQCGAAIIGPDGCEIHVLIRPVMPASAPRHWDMNFPIWYQVGDLMGASDVKVISVSAKGDASPLSHLYRSLLGRGPTRAELESWEWTNPSLGMSPSLLWIAAAGAIVDSFEFRASPQPIDRLYQAFFQRPPDAAGRAYWQQRLDAGIPPRALLEELSASPEFTGGLGQVLLGRVPNTYYRRQEHWLAHLYVTMFSRAPDAEGFVYWTRQLGRGACNANAMREQLERVALSFMQSPEYQARQRGGNEMLADLYQGLFQRTPDLEGFAYWRGRMQEGASLAEVRKALLQSPELAASATTFAMELCLF